MFVLAIYFFDIEKLYEHQIKIVFGLGEIEQNKKF